MMEGIFAGAHQTNCTTITPNPDIISICAPDRVQVKKRDAPANTGN
jgi:hypothetical protein